MGDFLFGAMVFAMGSLFGVTLTLASVGYSLDKATKVVDDA